jgi:hypothetical protein
MRIYTIAADSFELFFKDSNYFDGGESVVCCRTAFKKFEHSFCARKKLLQGPSTSPCMTIWSTQWTKTLTTISHWLLLYSLRTHKIKLEAFHHGCLGRMCGWTMWDVAEKRIDHERTG